MIKDPNLRNIIDAIPSAIFIINKDLKVIDVNQSALKIYNGDPQIVLKRLSGEILHCLNAKDSEEGCGTTEFCTDCVIRNSVSKSINGETVFKQKYKMQLQRGERIERVYMLISSAPLEHDGQNYALVTIDDITEITELANILPICASCKKIKRDEKFWENLENYFHKHTEIQFTHSICPECVEQLYPDLNSEKTK
jgi:PAS domain-containing protein